MQIASGLQELQRLQTLAWSQMKPATAFEKPTDKAANTGARLTWGSHFAVSCRPASELLQSEQTSVLLSIVLPQVNILVEEQQLMMSLQLMPPEAKSVSGSSQL